MVTYILHWPAYSCCIYIPYQDWLSHFTFVELREQSKKRLEEEDICEGVKVGWAARSMLKIRVNFLSFWQQRSKTLRQSPTYVGYYATVPEEVIITIRKSQNSGFGEETQSLQWLCSRLPNPFSVIPVKCPSCLCFNIHGSWQCVIFRLSLPSMFSSKWRRRKTRLRIEPTGTPQRASTQDDTLQLNTH